MFTVARIILIYRYNNKTNICCVIPDLCLLSFPVFCYYLVQFHLISNNGQRVVLVFNKVHCLAHKNLPPATFYLRSPAEAGPKATPTGGPKRSEWVSVAYKSRIKEVLIYSWISGSSPKMTIRGIPGSSPKMTKGKKLRRVRR